MGACNNKAFQDKTGMTTEDLKKSLFLIYDIYSNTINFLAAPYHGPNYQKLILSVHQPSLTKKEILNNLNRYTDHETGYYSTINLILAADGDVMQKHADYIRQLNWSIRIYGNENSVKVPALYRGLWWTEKEYDSYGLNTKIYIPSFTSTSKSIRKFYVGGNINSLLKIVLPHRPIRACEIKAEASKFYEDEEEILLAAYNKFLVKKKERNIEVNGRKIEFYIEMELINEWEKNLDSNTLVNVLSFI